MSAALLDTNYAPVLASYVSEINAEIALIDKYLPLARQLNDYDRGSHYSRRLFNLIETKCEFSYEQRVRFILEMELWAFDQASPFYLQTRALQMLHGLITRDIPADMLTLDWRKWYDNVRAYHFLAMRGLNYGEDLLSQHRKQWRYAVQKARRYFSAEAPLEIYETFSPFIQPFDVQGHRAILLICLMLPTHQRRHAAGYETIVPALFNSLTFVRNQFNCVTAVIQLFERLSKHHPETTNMMPYLPEFYQIFLQLLRLDIGRQSVQLGDAHTTDFMNDMSDAPVQVIAGSVATITVFSLHRKPEAGTNQRSALSLVSQLMHVVATYFHPSNTGRWTHPLAEFVVAFGSEYAIRRGAEMHGTCKYSKSLFLDPADNSVVSVLLPVCLRAMFSKSNTMVLSAQRCLSQLASFHPSLVLPAYLEHAYPALADLNSPHRMFSVMQSFQKTSQSLFDRKLYPQGAAHLDALLWACLPGVDPIDPAKTSLTLTFFTMVFTHVPFFDARHTDGLSRSRIDRHDAPVSAVHEKISARYKPESDAAGVEHEYEDEDVAMDDDDAEDNARSVTFKFEEWSLAFIDALFVVLDSVDKFAKAELADQQSILLLLTSSRAFFACLSEPIYKSVVAKLVKQLLSSHHPHAKKHWGTLVATASHAHPEIFLPAFFEPVYKRLVSGKNELLPLATSELEWNIYLLARSTSRAAGAGAAKHSLLAYRDRVVTLFRLTSSHKERSVRKSGHKLLKNFLVALSQVYPAEYHPFDTRQWSETEQWKHFNCWYHYTPVEERKHIVIDPMTVWHVPSAEELKAVEEIVNSELEAPLKVLADYVESGVLPATADSDASSDKTGKGDGPLERSLYTVTSVIRGAQAVLGDVAEDENVRKEIAKRAHFDGTRCPIAPEPVIARPIAPIKGLIGVLSTESTVRSSVLALVHRLSTRLLHSLSGPASGAASLKSLTSTLKLIFCALLLYGSNDMNLARDTMIADMMAASLRDYRSGYRCRNRPILVAQSYNLYQTFLRHSIRKQTYPQLVVDVLEGVHALAVNDFGKIRAKAQKVLRASIFTFPDSISLTITSMLNSLSDEKTTAEGIQGALTMLSMNNYQLLVSRKWTRINQTVDALFDMKISGNDRVEVLVMSYFSTLYPMMNPLQTETPLINKRSAPDVTDDDIARRNAEIERYSAETNQMYEALIGKLVRHSSNRALHWRYQMMATALLFALLRPGSLSSDMYSQVCQCFAHALHNELAPMRQIGNEALLHIFAMNTRATDAQFLLNLASMGELVDDLPTSVVSPSSSVTKSGSPLSTTSITSESDWLNTKFYDRLYSGWRDEPNAVFTRYAVAAGSDRYVVIKSADPFSSNFGRSCQTKQVKLPEPAFTAVKDIIVNHFSAIVDSMVHHHPTLAAAIEGQQQASVTGAAESIGQSVTCKLSSCRFPFNTLGMRSTAFDSNHQALIRGLVEVYPTFAYDPLMERELRRLIDHEAEQDYHCAAAEIVSGVIIGTRHASVHVQQAVQSMLLPMIMHAITVTSVDGLSHWTACLRHIYSNSDPRRLAWLTRALVEVTFQSLPGGTAVARAGSDVTNTLLTVKRFRCMLSVMAEQSYRSSALGSWILDRLWSDGWVTAPLRQIRNEATMVGAVALNGMYKIRMTNVSLGEFELVPSPAVLKLLSRMVTVLNATYAKQSPIKTDEDVNMDAKSSVELEIILDSTTVLFYQSIAVGQMESRSAVYQTLLPYVLRAQHSTDQDLSNLAKGASKLAAWVFLEGSVIRVENGQVSQSTRFDASAVIESVLQSVVTLLGAADTTWHVRVSALKYLQVVIPRHCVALTASQVKLVEKAILDRLSDPQAEVRASAALALTSLLSACLAHPSGAVIGFSSTQHVSQHMLSVQKRLRKLAATKQNIAARHGGVLGLLAIVACYPYDMPPHLPSLLADLASHVNDPAPISTAVKKAFADFTRTHADEWDSFKLKFTEEELDAVNSVQSAPTYFA